MATRRNTSLIAVDFGSSTVRLLQVAGQHVTAMELPCDMFAGDPINGDPDPGGLGEDLKRALADGGFQGRRCAVSLPATCFLLDTISLPDLNEAERAENLAWEAVDRFATEPNEVSVGALPLRAPPAGSTPPIAVAAASAAATNGAAAKGADASPAPADAATTQPAAPSTPVAAALAALQKSGSEFLMIALKRQTAMRALEPLLAAELSPVRLESSAFCGLRAAWMHWSRSADSPLAFVHIEPTQATMLMARDGELVFHRAIAGQFAMARSPAAASDPNAIPLEVRSVGSDRRAFRWSGLADEILQCLRYVERRGAGQWPGGLMTSGPCAGQVELLATLESICGVPSQSASAAGIVDPLPATLSPSVWATALGCAAVDLEQQTLLDARRAA